MASAAQPLQDLASASIPRLLRDLAMRMAFRYTRLGMPSYPYLVEPIQLATIVNELERTKAMPGSILEVGVAWGMTTRFICEHLIATGRCDEKLYALDTFTSFQPKHVEYEIRHRGKTHDQVSGFGYLDFEAWKRNFSEFKFLAAMKADCTEFDYSSIAPLKMVFLDVDLYLPTIKALRKIYPQLVAGGVILVDDVKDACRWDGACQAYTEFCTERGLLFERIGTKMGIIRK